MSVTKIMVAAWILVAITWVPTNVVVRKKEQLSQPTTMRVLVSNGVLLTVIIKYVLSIINA